MTAGGYKITKPTGQSLIARRVTEVIRSAMAKPALAEWELRQVATWCLTSNYPAGTTPRDAIAEYRAFSRTAANRGTKVHKWICAQLTGSPTMALDKTLMPYADAWCKWLADRSPGAPDLCETTLVEQAFEVAGTADAIFGNLLVDFKTSERPSTSPWRDHVAQLGAYACMPLTADLEPAPVIDRVQIVSLHADRTYRVHEVSINRAVRLWRACRTIAFDS